VEECLEEQTNEESQKEMNGGARKGGIETDAQCGKVTNVNHKMYSTCEQNVRACQNYV
jgi:hypothetical protein